MFYQKNILLVFLFIILGGALLFFGFDYLFKKENSNSFENQSALENSQKVLYIINREEGDISQYQISSDESSTVFSLLMELSVKENFEVDSTVYENMGIFVESIDGLKGGTNDKWWQYWVNDKLGEVAADKKIVESGDKIEWKFELPPQF